MNYIRLLCLCLLIAPQFNIVSAQDWQCIHDNASYWYESQSHSLWAVQIDSVGWSNGDKTYYGFHSVRIVSDSVSGPLNFYCAEPEGPSVMGYSMSVRESGNSFLNFAGDEITFLTAAPLNSSWLCCRITDSTGLHATVTSAGIETVLGVADSVKYITFQAKTNAGEPVNGNLNNKVFKLSKSYGMLTLYDFYRFPEYDSINSPAHELAGYSFNGITTGEQNLTDREVFSFSPGDEFHIFYESLDGPHGHESQGRTIKTILDSTWNSSNDTVSYTIRLLIDYWLGMSGDPHEYSCDTIIETYPVTEDDFTGLDYQPGEAVIHHSPQNGEIKATWYTQNRSSDYNFLWVKENRYHYTSCPYCADTQVGYIGGFFAENLKEFYIQGCGSGYFVKWWTDWSYDTYTTSRLLKYYRKGNETWGTPFDTSGWSGLSTNDLDTPNFIIYPNPATDHITLIFPGDFRNIYHIQLINSSGRIMQETDCSGNNITLVLDKTYRGLFLVRILKEDKLVSSHKVILNRY